MAGMYGCFKSRNSDSGSMASGPPDVMTNQEPAEGAEECSGKKKSKFQTFKKFFTRKKRKEPPAAAAAAAGADAGLKASQSSDDVSKTSDNNTLTRSEKEKGSGSKISLGSKALSHDSVFVSDSSEANEALGASQDSIHGKVKSLQLQLKQAIKLGSPPSLMCVKRTEDAGTMSEDDGLPCSPPEYTTLHAAMNQVERNSSVSLEGLDSDDDQLSCPAPSRAMSPLVVPGDFSQPASPFGCLDNSAAKHKLGLRHKACNKRKPVARLEMKFEADSMTPNTSVTEASEEKDQQETTTEAADEPTSKVEVEEEEKTEDEEEEDEESRHATQSLLRDKEQREEGEDELDAGQDVSQGLDTSCPTESCPSEEEVPDVQPPSSRASSGAASLDSPRNTPEPPAGQREHVLDPPAVAHEEEEDAAEGDLLPTTEEDGVQEESSFLQEVLSSLKTPLAPSPSTGEAEADHLEVEEVKEGEDVGAEEEEEEEEVEEAEMEEPVSDQVLPADSLPSQQTTKEEEEVSAFRSTCQDEEEEEEHKAEDKEEEAAAEEEEEEEEEELMVEQICPLSEKEEEEKGEEEEVPIEHQNDLLPENPVAQEEGRGDEESEPEEEEAELEKQEEEVEEAEEAAEALMDVAEDVMQHEAASEDADVAVTLQDEGDEDDAMNVPESRDAAEIPAELHGQVMKSEAAASPSCEEQEEEEEEEEEERMEEGEDEHKPEGEEDDGANRPDEDQTEPDVEQEAAEESLSDMERVEAAEEAPVPFKPSPLSLPESHDKAQPLEGAPITPTKTSTTTLHINLVSPSSEKATSFFQQSQNVEHPKDSETISAAEEATEQNTPSAEEEEEEDAGAVEAVEEEKQLVPEEEEKETPSPASAEDPVHQSSSGSAQSKVRFTVAPSWQRSLSAEDAKDTATPPSTPPASCVSSPSPAIAGPGDEAEEAEEPAASAEGEQVFVSDTVRNTKAPAAKPQRSPASPPSPVKTPTSASTEESSVIMEGNPDNPFGVRLRKTSGLYRFSSEEENAEPHVEAAAQASSSKVDSPQPVSVKPSISPPASTKPALPKKPDVHGDGAGKSRRISEPAAGRGVSGGSDSPSWITMAKQKQKIYKENSLEEIAVKKEEQERKSSLPMYVSSAVSREHGGAGKTAESTGKGSLVESGKSSASAEKEPRRSLSPPTPVPAQTPKSQSFPSPVPPKPQPPPATSKPPPHKSMSPPTPVPVAQKPASCTSPPPPSKPAASANAPQPQSAAVTSPPFSPRTTASEKPVLRAPGLPSQTPSSQRGGPPPALPQDEPPWMALAKKKAKAWSEMPQIAPV